MKTALFIFIAIISYIVAINLSTTLALIILLLFTAISVVLWILPTFYPINFLSSATTGEHINTSDTPIIAAIACLAGGFIGLIATNEKWQNFFLNLLVP